MNKETLLEICESTHSKIISENYNKEALLKRIAEFSSNNKTISSEQQLIFCLLESQSFAKDMVYRVLSEVLNLDDDSSDNSLDNNSAK